MTAILDILCRRQSDWAALAKSDAGAAGTIARDCAVIRKDMAMYATSSGESARVDDATMTSWWTVSTINRDREGDVLIPTGCLNTIDNYRRNPVVLLEHAVDKPIGISIGDRGLPLIIDDSSIKAGLKHHDLTPVARDTYKLV